VPPSYRTAPRRIVRKEESLEKKLLGKTPKKILKFLQGSDGISTIGEIASENFIPEGRLSSMSQSSRQLAKWK
jgi:hypothetical protein